MENRTAAYPLLPLQKLINKNHVLAQRFHVENFEFIAQQIVTKVPGKDRQQVEVNAKLKAHRDKLLLQARLQETRIKEVTEQLRMKDESLIQSRKDIDRLIRTAQEDQARLTQQNHLLAEALARATNEISQAKQMEQAAAVELTEAKEEISSAQLDRAQKDFVLEQLKEQLRLAEENLAAKC